MPQGSPLFSRFFSIPEASWGRRLDEDLVTAHPVDVVDVLDVDGAFLDARPAVGA